MTVLIKNDMNYVFNFFGKKIPRINTDETLSQLGISMPKIENPVTTVTPRLVADVMDEMVWPSMGRSQVAVNQSALTTHSVVSRYFRKLDENNEVMRNESGAREAIKHQLRLRRYLDN